MGVVLRRTDLGETDRLLYLLSEDQGVLQVVAKGARKPGSRLCGASEPLASGRFTFAEGRHRRYLQRVDQAAGWPAMRRDYGKLAAALALAQLADCSLPHESPAPEVYEWLVSSLQALESAQAWQPAFVWAAVRLLEVEGQAPRWAHLPDGTPVATNPARLSVRSGGLVAEGELADSFPARAEALIGLERIAEREAPPRHLRFGEECVAVLVRYWAETLGRMPPALEALLAVP